MQIWITSLAQIMGSKWNTPILLFSELREVRRQIDKKMELLGRLPAEIDRLEALERELGEKISFYR